MAPLRGPAPWPRGTSWDRAGKRLRLSPEAAAGGTRSPSGTLGGEARVAGAAQARPGSGTGRREGRQHAALGTRDSGEESHRGTFQAPMGPLVAVDPERALTSGQIHLVTCTRKGLHPVRIISRKRGRTPACLHQQKPDQGTTLSSATYALEILSPVGIHRGGQNPDSHVCVCLSTGSECPRGQCADARKPCSGRDGEPSLRGHPAPRQRGREAVASAVCPSVLFF